MAYDRSILEGPRWHLLGLLGTGEAISNTLSVAQWSMLDEMARLHRLEPLLRTRASTAPADLRASWNAAYRQSVVRSLAMQATLIRAAAALDAAGIAYAALKGAWLAWHAYGHPAERPMRDIDLLVSPQNLAASYRALIAHGFVESTGAPFSDETLALDHKHLPALRDAATGIHLELHSRLFEHVAAAARSARLLQVDALLADRVELALAHARIAYLPPCETLLHLAIHAAHEHRFDNGPQILHDVARLLSRETIDWTRFWSQAREGGWSRSCALVLRLTERVLGPQPVVWDAEAALVPPDAVLDAAALMLLQDPAMRRDIDVRLLIADRSGGGWSRLMGVAGRFLPSRRALATYADVPPDSRFLWLYYPGWLATRLLRTLSTAFNANQRQEATRAGLIEEWLSAP